MNRRSQFKTLTRALSSTFGICSAFVVAGIGAIASVWAQSPMSLPGKFDVSATGAAVYSIPIAVPPGTAGMVPTLSLDYSSQAGDGIVGVGWSLGGLASVTRCPQTFVQDGARGGINFDANDRFCLDGQRLMAINSGTYGADGTEYRTEIESFTRVISHGTAGNGPGWFEVHTKSGQVMEFGHSADSLILAQGKTTARSWALNKVSDTKGNYYTVSYTNDTTNGQAYPIEINYTGNTSASLTPYNKVQFVYATRPDITPLYQAGSLSQTTVRLIDIKTFAGNTLINDYQLSYQQSSSTQRSEIVAVTQCAGDGGCLPPTNITWQGQSSIPNTAAFSGPWNGYHFNTGDFNGDGKTDALLCAQTACSLYLSNGTGLVATGFTATWGGYLFYSGDFDGDGKTDLLMCTPNVTDPTCYINYFNGNGFSQWSFTPNWGGYQIVTGDWNGDGRTDVAVCPPGANSTCSFYISTGSGFTQLSFSANWGGWEFVPGDFDGDGKTDLLMCRGSACSLYISNGTGFAQSSFGGGALWGNYWITAADFNGDGKTDLLMCPPLVSPGASGSACFINYSTGTGFSQSNFPNTWGNSQIIPGQFNGDSMADLLVCTPSSCSLYYSNGTGFSPSNFTANWSGVNFAVGDFNGDGATDIWTVPTTFNGSAQLYFTTFSPESVVSINNGLATTAIGYSPLTSSSVYTKDAISTYPIQDIQPPLSVVSRVDTSNGVGGTISSAYSYAGMKADLGGRGFLGFRQMTATDLQTNILQTSNVRQDFPYLGLVASTTKTLSGVTLNQTTNTYGTTPLGGTRSQIFLSQSVTASSDLDGSVLPTLTTTYQYDAFGNATKVTTATSDGFSKTTTNTYTNDTTAWVLGRLTNAIVLASEPTPPSLPPSGAPDVPILQVVNSHSGDFTQGAAGAYTITVSNVGGLASGGAVSVTDTLPAGLTATAISGAGWSCVLGTLTCTRSDVLLGGQQFPSITLTVNVAANAPFSMTNVASVSGGGSTSNTANNPTIVHSTTPTRIYLTSGGSWVVPSDWNNNNNTIEVIGGGGGGGSGSINASQGGAGGGGGGGGAYSKVTNLSLTVGATVTYNVGAGGATATSGGDTWFNGTTFSASSVSAKGGGGGGNATAAFNAGGQGLAGAGGAGVSGIGNVKFSGGGATRAPNGTTAGGGGGGAAGPAGNGASGGSVDSGNSTQPGGGGGGANNGTAGGVSRTGGNGNTGTGGGAVGNPGANGFAGGGGGGAQAGNQTQVNLTGGNGGSDTAFDASHGSGGGGGGGAYNYFTGTNTGSGGRGAFYGGGGAGGAGAGASGPGVGGSGAQGIVVITYTR